MRLKRRREGAPKPKYGETKIIEQPRAEHLANADVAISTGLPIPLDTPRDDYDVGKLIFAKRHRYARRLWPGRRCCFWMCGARAILEVGWAHGELSCFGCACQAGQPFAHALRQ